jgi:hypothetical protein
MLYFQISFIIAALAFLAWNRGVDFKGMLLRLIARKPNLNLPQRSGIRRLVEIRDQLKHALDSGNLINLDWVVRLKRRAEEVPGEKQLSTNTQARSLVYQIKELSKQIAFANAAIEGERKARSPITVAPPPKKRAVVVDNSGQRIPLDAIDKPFDLEGAAQRKLRRVS